jgi:lipoprotein-anchoring transpeptidase ErfK/SrfK
MMRRIAWVGLAWLMAALFAFSPILTAAPIVSAQSEETTPVGPPIETETPVSPVASETPVDIQPTVTIEATEVATEPSEPTATEEASQAASPAPSETTQPAETATQAATETATAEPTKKASETPAFTAAIVTDLEITLSCTTAPETIRIKNNGLADILLKGIATYLDPIAEEPFAISRNLKPGQTAIFQSGDGAQYGTVLTKRFILTNTGYDSEGVRFNTSAGGTSKMCPPKPAPPAALLSDLKVTVSCTTAAETIRVQNTGTGYATIKGIATYIDPIAEEPFAVSRVLKPGTTATYQAGAEAQYGTILTKKYIFTNAAYEKDGVRVNTNVGKLFKACPPKPVPPERWIEVNLSWQYLIAWVGNTRVNETYVSTGKPGFDTPTGTYYVLYRYRYDTMQGCIQGECYYVPDVPWTQYFTNVGHALHGAYWHNDFGTTRSHGCINLPLWFAEWLWNWATWGTRIWIHY